MKKESAELFLNHYALLSLSLDIPREDALTFLISRDRRVVEYYYNYYFKGEKENAIPFSRIMNDILFDEEVGSFLKKKIDIITKTLSRLFLSGLKSSINKKRKEKKGVYFLNSRERWWYYKYKSRRGLDFSSLFNDISYYDLPSEIIDSFNRYYSYNIFPSLGRIAMLYSMIEKKKKIIDKVFYGHNKYIPTSNLDGKIKLLEIVQDIQLLLKNDRLLSQKKEANDIIEKINSLLSLYDVKEERIASFDIYTFSQ